MLPCGSVNSIQPVRSQFIKAMLSRELFYIKKKKKGYEDESTEDRTTPLSASAVEMKCPL